LETINAKLNISDIFISRSTKLAEDKKWVPCVRVSGA